jgi:hypothetical protein
VQKNYKDFTVGELLDLGLNVEIRKHGVKTLSDGIDITKMFEGTKQSTSTHSNFNTVNAWKGKFRVTAFINK